MIMIKMSMEMTTDKMMMKVCRHILITNDSFRIVIPIISYTEGHEPERHNPQDLVCRQCRKYILFQEIPFII